MLPSRRDALVWFAKFAVIFVVLMAPWPRVGEVFSIGFSVLATSAVETFIDDRDIVVRFAPAPNPKPGLEEWNVEFSASNVQNNASTKVPIEARELAYVPFATLMALAFATTLDRRRRWAIVLGGSAILGLRLVVAVGLPVARYFGSIAPGSVAEGTARVVFWALIEPPDMMFAAPVVTFLLGLLLTHPASARDEPVGDRETRLRAT